MRRRSVLSALMCRQIQDLAILICLIINPLLPRQTRPPGCRFAVSVLQAIATAPRRPFNPLPLPTLRGRNRMRRRRPRIPNPSHTTHCPKPRLSLLALTRERWGRKANRLFLMVSHPHL
jgi:hypothetical protein